MATYYHGAPEMQSDGLQTLYLMNPSFVGYAVDSSPPASNMAFVNNSGEGNLPHAQQHQQQQQQQFVGIPLPEIATAHGLFPRAQYHQHHLWNISPANNSGDLTSQLGFRRTTTQQGLSLTLSSQQGSYGIHPPAALVTTAMIGQASGEEVRFSDGSAAPENEIVGEKVLLGSKYLKAAQQILDEVVSVGKGVNKNEGPKSMWAAKAKQESDDGIGEKRPPTDLSTAERQELQMKKAKLVNMLDEVEQRYRQYNHQMQVVISSFESIAGVGAATTYTALALRTISKQFRCLRDAIAGQIRATSKNMGEEDCKTDGGSGSTSRLRFVDHHLRQQKALQQLGMMQHNAWRPQRGLPERSVSVLRAWLFEHFLHPYPKDSDKHILAKQTGLTRNQVSNWFINARVRLWKPMVEEMYLEETKDQQPLVGDEIDKESKSDDTKSSNAPPPTTGPDQTALYTAGDDDHDAKNHHLKKPRSAADEPTFLQPHDHLGGAVDEMDMKPLVAVDVNGGAVTDLFMRFNDNAGWFGAPRFSGNGVSLTLGLQHCEGLPAPTYQLAGDGGMALSGEYSNHGIAIAGDGGNDSPATNGYGNLTIQSRKRFAAPLLPDFVA